MNVFNTLYTVTIPDISTTAHGSAPEWPNPPSVPIEKVEKNETEINLPIVFSSILDSETVNVYNLKQVKVNIIILTKIFVNIQTVQLTHKPIITETKNTKKRANFILLLLPILPIV